jgi:hypothetical protein
MLKNGIGPGVIEKILGENFLRVVKSLKGN